MCFGGPEWPKQLLGRTSSFQMGEAKKCYVYCYAVPNLLILYRESLYYYHQFSQRELSNFPATRFILKSVGMTLNLFFSVIHIMNHGKKKIQRHPDTFQKTSRCWKIVVVRNTFHSVYQLQGSGAAEHPTCFGQPNVRY